MEEAFRDKTGDSHCEYNIYKQPQQYGRENLVKRFAQQLRSIYSDTNYATHKPCMMVDKLVERFELPTSIIVIKNK